MKANVKATETRVKLAFRVMTFTSIVNVIVAGSTNHPIIAVIYALSSYVFIKYRFWKVYFMGLKKINKYIKSTMKGIEIKKSYKRIMPFNTRRAVDLK